MLRLLKLFLPALMAAVILSGAAAEGLPMESTAIAPPPKDEGYISVDEESGAVIIDSNIEKALVLSYDEEESTLSVDENTRLCYENGFFTADCRAGC